MLSNDSATPAVTAWEPSSFAPHRGQEWRSRSPCISTPWSSSLPKFCAAVYLEIKAQITARGFLPQEVHLRSELDKGASLVVLMKNPTTVRFPVRITDSTNKVVEKARVRYAAPDKKDFLDCPLLKDEKGQLASVHGRLPDGLAGWAMSTTVAW